MVGRPDGHSEQLFTLLARLAQILVIAIFAGWAVTRLRSDIGSLTVVVLVALLIGVVAWDRCTSGRRLTTTETTTVARNEDDPVCRAWTVKTASVDLHDQHR